MPPRCRIRAPEPRKPRAGAEGTTQNKPTQSGTDGHGAPLGARRRTRPREKDQTNTSTERSGTGGVKKARPPRTATPSTVSAPGERFSNPEHAPTQRRRTRQLQRARLHSPPGTQTAACSSSGWRQAATHGMSPPAGTQPTPDGREDRQTQPAGRAQRKKPCVRARGSAGVYFTRKSRPA